MTTGRLVAMAATLRTFNRMFVTNGTSSTVNITAFDVL